MKKIFIAAVFLVCSLGQAQEAPATETSSKTELYEMERPETYSLNNQVFTFTPEGTSIKIKKLENKKEVDYGQLRKTTDDGLYIMTSNLSEDVSFGRFDTAGNFKTMRYDRKQDTVLEEVFQKRKEQTQLSSKK